MRILNFGSLNLDHVYAVPHFVSAGETLSSDAYQTNLGGKGFNQSVALANAGATVFHAGCTGPDGGRCKAYLERKGVDTSYLESVETPTGHAVIQVDAAGQNCILLYGGANQCVTRAQIDETLSHFGSGDLLLLQNEISNIAYLADCGIKRGMRVALNPSPISAPLLQMDINALDWLLLNEVEGAALCGDPDTARMLQNLHARFPACSILLTLGDKGSQCSHQGASYACPALPVAALDTTAAGDTFTGYFLCGLAEGLAVPAAMALAAAAAALTVTRPGAADAIPMRNEAEAALRTFGDQSR